MKINKFFYNSIGEGEILLGWAVYIALVRIEIQRMSSTNQTSVMVIQDK